MSLTLIPDLKQYEQKLSSTERRKLDMVQQVLNNHSNFSNEKENICDLFKTYANVLKSSKKSFTTLPLERSEISFRDKRTLKNNVKSLENDNPQSFLIVPLYSEDHMFTTVIRKRDNQYISTIVNKGDRPSLRGQFVEHRLSENGMEELINELNNSLGEKSTSAIYSIFNKHSDSHRILNIHSNDQKVGNCYIKEPENAIKYAFATINFTNEQFEDLFKNKINFKPKWDALTVNMHRKLVEQVAKEHPNMIPVLQSEMYVYEINKQFREAVQQGKDISSEQIKGFLPYVNMDTMDRFECILSINNGLDKVGETEKTEDVRTMSQMTQGTINDYGHKRFFSDLNKLENEYPVLARQIKYEKHSDLLIHGLNSLYTVLEHTKHRPVNPSTTLRHLNDSIKLYPNNFMTYATAGLAHLEFNHLDKALHDLNKAIGLREDVASLYYLRSQVYSKQQEHELSKADLKLAKQLDDSCIQRWKNEKNFDVLIEYFGLGYKPKLLNQFEFNKDTSKLQRLLENGKSRGIVSDKLIK